MKNKNLVWDFPGCSMLLSRASLTDPSVWVSVGESWGIGVLNSLSGGLLVWLSLGYCGVWIKLRLWTWDLGKVGVGDVENHQHVGRSGNSYERKLPRSCLHSGEGGVRAEETQDRTLLMSTFRGTLKGWKLVKKEYRKEKERVSIR